MSHRDDRIVRTADVEKASGLPEPVARELVMEETRKALRRSGAAWAILLGGFALAGWLQFGPDRGGASGLGVGVLTVCAWMAIGRYLAGDAIMRAARAKAQRIRGTSE